MTKDDLFFMIQVASNLEFVFNNKTYRLFYAQNKKGKNVIMFGELYDAKEYESFGELYSQAKVENHYFREILEVIKP